ncbi:MAG: hypothetical protein IJJ48_07970 [Firmicutes bacterium]|nr:hypothetical protein [Bacillota bacterium]
MKKKKTDEFTEYTKALTEERKGALDEFFAVFEQHCSLQRSGKRRLRKDFEDSLLFYSRTGVPFEEALVRIDPSKLGAFYLRPPVLWYALEDSAKIYPLSMKHGEMAVFRLSVYLKEEVVPEILQMALDFIIKRFPGFAVSLKKGFFWHYLDTAKRRFAVEEESGIPCSPIRLSRSGSPAFRVIWYGKRISVEFFHVLTDGTGGMEFLKSLTGEYLKLLGVSFHEGEGVIDADSQPRISEYENAFSKVENDPESSGFVDKAAVQMSGKLSRVKPAAVIHFRMDAESLRAAAKQRGATVTVYMLGLMFLASRAATDAMEGELSIQVPVNMRKFYPTDTLRNFSLYCWVRIPLKEIEDGPSLTKEIKAQLEERSSEKSMRKMLTMAKTLVSTVRYIPLFIKQPVASVIYGFLGDKIFSNTLSNLGVVTLPKEIAEHVESMDFLLGTASTNRAECTLVTTGGTATFTVTKNTKDPTFEEKMYKLLEKDGIKVEAEGSGYYEY